MEQYLPLLENLVYHVGLVCDNPRMVRWTSDLKIRWSSALSSSSFFFLTGPKYFRIDNLQFELGMTLFLYGAMIREWASEVLSVGKELRCIICCIQLVLLNENDCMIVFTSDTVADLVQSATLFRKAAGVYHYLALEVFPHMLSSSALERQPEATSSVSSVMSLICLAEAQVSAWVSSLVILALLEKLQWKWQFQPSKCYIKYATVCCCTESSHFSNFDPISRNASSIFS